MGARILALMLNEAEDHQAFLQALAEAPIGAEFRASIAAKRLETRRGLRAQLEDAEKAYSGEIGSLDAGVAAAVETLRSCEMAVIEARGALDVANAARAAAWSERERLGELYARQLRSTEHPGLAEFRKFIGDEIAKLPAAFESVRDVSTDGLGRRSRRTVSNAESVNTRREFLLSAYRRCESLALEADDEIVAATIAALKASLPAIEQAEL